MARQEHDREDLIAEAKALRTRVELRAAGMEEPIVVGVRDTGWLSVYFGDDPVYHFDEQGGLRRAFVGGQLLRSHGSTLARLVRSRTGSIRSELIRTDLTPEELSAFVAHQCAQIGWLCELIDGGKVQTLRQVSVENAPLVTLRTALERARSGRLAPELRSRR